MKDIITNHPMTPHTYKPGDLVKIISMEEVRKYPAVDLGRWINNWFWNNEMDQYAGTIQKISEIILDCPVAYLLEGLQFSFTNKMISGPAEVEQEGEGQEEVTQDELIDALEDKRILNMLKENIPDGLIWDTPVPNAEMLWHLSRKNVAEDLLDKYTITRKK